jgi:hypothetical protein
LPRNAERIPHPDGEQRDPDIGRSLFLNLFHHRIDRHIEDVALDDFRHVTVQAHFRGQVQQAQGGRVVGDVFYKIIALGDPLVGGIDEEDFPVRH